MSPQFSAAYLEAIGFFFSQPCARAAPAGRAAGSRPCHGRAAFSLDKGQAAVWLNYNPEGRLLPQAIHAAGTVYDGTKVVLAALFEVEGFSRPDDIEQQAADVADSLSTHHGIPA